MLISDAYFWILPLILIVILGAVLAAFLAASWSRAKRDRARRKQKEIKALMKPRRPW